MEPRRSAPRISLHQASTDRLRPAPPPIWRETTQTDSSSCNIAGRTCNRLQIGVFPHILRRDRRLHAFRCLRAGHLGAQPPPASARRSCSTPSSAGRSSPCTHPDQQPAAAADRCRRPRKQRAPSWWTTLRSPTISTALTRHRTICCLPGATISSPAPRSPPQAPRSRLRRLGKNAKHVSHTPTANGSCAQAADRA